MAHTEKTEIHDFWLKSLKERIYLEDLGTDGMILKWIAWEVMI